MDNNGASPNEKLLLDGFGPEKVEIDGVDKEEDDDCDDDESSALLSSPRRGGISKKNPKSTRRGRKVQWNDRAGNKLVEILEFQPSDASDTDEDDDLDSCICSVM